MKKIVAIFFFIILFLSIFGLYPIYTILQYQARMEMAIRIHKGIPEKNLHEFVFTGNNAPDWIKDGKEFAANGHLFDIVKKICSGDSTIYYCVKDVKETRLKREVHKMISMSMQRNFKSRKVQKKLPNFYELRYLNGKLNSAIYFDNLKNKQSDYQQYYFSPSFPPPVPPPQA